MFDLNEPQISSFKFLKDQLKTKTEFRPATNENYSLQLIGKLDWENNKLLYKSRLSQPITVDFLIEYHHAYTLRNAPMDIHNQYTSEIQHEIALLTTGKANYGNLSQLSIYLKSWTTLNESMSHGKTIIATTVGYEDEQY